MPEDFPPDNYTLDVRTWLIGFYPQFIGETFDDRAAAVWLDGSMGWVALWQSDMFRGDEPRVRMENLKHELARRIQRVKQGLDPIEKPPPPPPTQHRTPKGVVRAHGERSIADDGGPFLALTLSRFYLLHAWHFDRARAEREIIADAAAGFDGIRVCYTVESFDDGHNYWQGLELHGNEPWLDADAVAMTRFAYEQGIRIDWTILGKGPSASTQDARRRLVRRFCQAIKTAPEGVLMIEAINEPQVGRGGDGGSVDVGDVVELIDLMQAEAPGLLSGGGAVWTQREWIADNPGGYEGATAFSGEGMRRMAPRGVVIVHMDRDTSKSELQDRPWRQPWDIGLEGRRWNDREHIGPGASVQSESRANVLRGHRATAFVCRSAISCLHGDPGVRGRRPWTDEPAYGEAYKCKRFLPGDLPDGSQQNANASYPLRPFDLAHEWLRGVNGNTKGCVRVYSNRHQDVYYCHAIGLLSDFPLVAARPMAVRVCSQQHDTVYEERQVSSGETVHVKHRGEDDLIIEARDR